MHEKEPLVTKVSNVYLYEAYVTVTLLCIINLLNYMDRYAVASVLLDIEHYFDLDNRLAGLVQTIFVCAYMLSAPIAGYLGDRYRHQRKRLLIMSMCIWCTSTFICSLIANTHFRVFLATRALVGVGEACYSTITPTIFADLFPVVNSQHDNKSDTEISELYNKNNPSYDSVVNYTDDNKNNNNITSIIDYQYIDTNRTRLLCLSAFYLAIPVGSGLGYIVSSSLAQLTGTWEWGLRLTPLIGLVLIAIFYWRIDNINGPFDLESTEPLTVSTTMSIPTTSNNVVGNDEEYTETQPLLSPKTHGKSKPQLSEFYIDISATQNICYYLRRKTDITLARFKRKISILYTVLQNKWAQNDFKIGNMHKYASCIYNAIIHQFIIDGVIKAWLLGDIRRLIGITSYRRITFGVTCVSFVVGALALWAPTLMQLSSSAIKDDFDWLVTPSEEPMNQQEIGLVFGLVTCFAGIFGIMGGAAVSKYLKASENEIHNNPQLISMQLNEEETLNNPFETGNAMPITIPTNANQCNKLQSDTDARVCGFALLIGSPILLAALYLSRFTAANYSLLTFWGGYLLTQCIVWGAIFVAEALYCSCWALVVDMTLAVVPSTLRTQGQAAQMLISHALGDASSAYIVGAISTGLLYNTLYTPWQDNNIIIDIPPNTFSTFAHQKSLGCESFHNFTNSYLFPSNALYETNAMTTIPTEQFSVNNLGNSMKTNIVYQTFSFKQNLTNSNRIASFAERFRALQYALFLTPFMGVCGAAFFLAASFSIQRDIAKLNI